MPLKRPFGVTLFLWLVLMLSAGGAVRFYAALRWWGVLYEFDASVSPLYLLIGGAVWCVAGGVLYWLVATRKPRARSALLASIILWYVQFWVERMFFQAPRANTGFVLTVTTLLLAVVVVGVNLPGMRTYFTMSEDHEQADQPTKTI